MRGPERRGRRETRGAERPPRRHRAVVLVGVGFGLRPGEVFGLEVGDVDVLRRTVTVRRQLDEHRQQVPRKTGKSYRTLPLSQVVAEELARHLAETGVREGLTFLGHDGQPVRRTRFDTTWRRAAVAVRVPGLRLHELRHACASALVAAGESVQVVQARLGHAPATLTFDVHGHLWPDSDGTTRAAVDDFLPAPAAADRLRIAGGDLPVSGRVPHFLEKA